MQNTNKCYLCLKKQLLAPKGNKTKQNKEIHGLKFKIIGLEKILRIMKVKLAKMEKKFNKETKCPSAQNGNKQNVDKVNIQTLRQEVKPPPVPGAALTSTLSQELSGKVLKEKGPNTPRIQPNWSSEEEPLSVSQRSIAPSSTPDLKKILEKRPGSSMSPEKNVKVPRLDTHSPNTASPTPLANSKQMNSMSVAPGKSECHTGKSLIYGALKTLQKSCFDALPTIAGRLLFGRISEIPGLGDEEKSVVSDFCENRASAQDFMSAILCMIKAEGAAMKHEFLQTLCRVYVGMCQKTGDSHKAHALAYRLLKEDFPEAPKLILVMATAWPGVFSHDSSLCQAIHKVTKLKAEGDILDYLGEHLHWDEPSADVHKIISSTLKALLQDSSLTFKKNSWYGFDLCPAAWDYIFSLDLLCTQQGWMWTFKNIISQEIWLNMSTWLMQKRSQHTAVGDVCIAALLRLLGRLGQLGLKEKEARLVKNLANGIKDFGNYRLSDVAGMPWEVQLSVFYATHDLAPGNPREALEALTSWQERITQPVPPAVTSCITQISTLCQKI
ncbi:little elongation complex subunit 1-like isoform X2 [Tachysurus fulvidraco]|uniref:little elongation complex subunit 1-like isoform X2 n=1 Tax=Tachysurus fulvidraco TaxID=1234273 RepID=UPI000F4E3B61|nr:little elongation complex subunit 1-like isoform X2 [Tachysurus fulvidraco]